MRGSEKPRQSFAGLWNISFGFFGIQIGFALQNANMSRIFQSLGSSLDDLPALWIAAPLTGLLVQPIIGHMSDRTWLGRLGRRRPYFVAGAILAALSLILMPLAPALLFAALLLWMLDASLNISMEPFRAFVGDMLRKDQHTAGYAVQTAFIGAGAVLGSLIPPALEKLGVSNLAANGGIPDTLRYAFWIGGAALFLAVLWTVLTTREYSPDEMAEFNDPAGHPDSDTTVRTLASRSFGPSAIWIAAGAIVIFAVAGWRLEKEMYLLGGLLIAYGLASIAAILLARRGATNNMLAHIVGDFSGMPPVMKRLAVVQFFSWSALFIMWIYTTPVVAQYFFNSPDPTSAGYQDAGNRVGELFAIYNGVAAVAALILLPWLSRRIGKARTHMICLLAGAAAYASFFIIRDTQWLVLSEIGVGIAWASILAMPYAILASNLPQGKLGIYMGLFNIFIVVPQLLVATVMGSIMKAAFPHEPIWTMLFAAVVMAIAAVSMLGVTKVEAKTEEEQIGAVIDEMYAMISGPAGPRDWSRQSNCFLPEARQVRTFIGEDGRPAKKIMGLEDYAKNTQPFFNANAFYEIETARRIDVFGNMAHVWSNYEARTSPDDATAERRGINSIQLFRDPDQGWRIVSMIWDNER